MSNEEPSDALIRSYDLGMVEAACLPGGNRWSAKINLGEDVSEAMPFLNSVLGGTEYDHDAKVLVCKHEGFRYAFRPFEIRIAPVENREDAQRQADRVIGLVNDIWRRRAEIEPRYEGRKLPDLMAVYKLLPRTNCRECGRPTCMAFARDLREGKDELCQCIPLSKPEYAENRRKLEELLEGKS